MGILVNCQGDVIKELTEQEEQVYKALEKWAIRLNKWECTQQVKHNKGKKLKQFTPNGTSLLLIDNMKALCNTMTPEEAISILHTIEVRTQLNLCMQAGF